VALYQRANSIQLWVLEQQLLSPADVNKLTKNGRKIIEANNLAPTYRLSLFMLS